MPDWDSRNHQVGYNPREDRMWNQIGPDAQVDDMKEVQEEIERTKEHLESNTVEIMERFMRTVGHIREVKKKAHRVEQELEDL